MRPEIRMSQRIELTQQQKIEIRQQARIEMKQKLQAEMQLMLSEFSIESEDATNTIYDLVVKTYLEKMKLLEGETSESESDQSKALAEFFASHKAIFLELLSPRKSQLVLRGKTNIALLESLVELSYLEIEKDKTTRAHVENAIEKPVQTEKEIELIEKNIHEMKAKKDAKLKEIQDLEKYIADLPETATTQRSQAEDELKELKEEEKILPDPGLMVKGLTELLEARNFSQIFQTEVAPPFLSLFKQLLHTEVEGKKLLQEFLLDRNVMEALVRDLNLPEKIIGNMRQRLNEESTPSRRKAYEKKPEVPTGLKNMVTNTVGQLILVSLGIIDEDIFTLRKGQSISPDDQAAFQKATGRSFEDMMKKYNFTAHKGFVFYRYSVIGQVPTIETDNKIRDFITKTVRTHQTEILEKMGLERIFGDLMDQVGNDDEDREATVDNKIEELFHDDFIEYLIEEIRNKYLAELQKQGLKKS